MSRRYSYPTGFCDSGNHDCFPRLDSQQSHGCLDEAMRIEVLQTIAADTDAFPTTLTLAWHTRSGPLHQINIPLLPGTDELPWGYIPTVLSSRAPSNRIRQRALQL